MKTERKERGQTVPLPLRATMLKLLRLPLFRSLRAENSRNPGHRPALALISPMLSVISGSRLARFTSARSAGVTTSCNSSFGELNVVT
jgi:hypothetical protein